MTTTRQTNRHLLTLAESARAPMNQYPCNTCGKPLGAAWLIHCPHCGAQVQEERR